MLVCDALRHAACACEGCSSPFGAESSRYCTEEGGEWGGWRGETYLPRRPRGLALEAGKAPVCTRCPSSQTTPGHQRRSVSSQSRRAQCDGAATMQGAAAGRRTMGRRAGRSRIQIVVGIKVPKFSMLLPPGGLTVFGQ